MAKRANGDGTIYKDVRGYWVAQYRVDGKRKTISGRTQAEVRERLRAIQHDISNEEYTVQGREGRMTLGEWADRWLEDYAKPSVKTTTYESYESYIRNQIKPNIGNVRLSQISVDTFQRFFNLMAQSGKTGSKEGLSVKTLYNLRNMLHYMMDQAVRNRLMKFNPVDAVKLPKHEKIEMRVLSKDEQAKLLAAVNRSPDPAALGITFSLFTGVRLGEMLGLKWSSVDIDRRQFHVKEILRRITNPDKDSPYSTIVTSLQTTKTESSNRIVPIIDELAADLIAYKAWQDGEAAINPAFNPDEYVFTTVGGSYIEPRTYEDLFKRTVKAAGIPDANFHCLRHTFATRAIEAGMDVLVLSKILGHAQPSTTLNMYGHVLPDHKRESMEKIRGLYAMEPAGESGNTEMLQPIEQPQEVKKPSVKKKKRRSMDR